MSRCKHVVGLAVAALALALCLFGSVPVVLASRWLGPVVQEVLAAFRDPGTQWMVFLCLGVYFVTLTLLQRRQARQFGAHGVTRPTLAFSNPDFWLTGGLLIGTFGYAFNYSAAAKSTEALMLLAGATLGKGAAVWAGWGGSLKSKGQRLKPDGAVQDTGKHRTFNIEHPTSNDGIVASGAHGVTRPALILCVLVFLLAAAAFWQPETGMQFHYRGQARWSGPWDNPNICGMLMGVGVALAVGQLLLLKANIQPRTSNLEPRTGGDENAGVRTGKRISIHWISLLFLLTAAGVMAVGLVKSYSRGAWVATLCGLGYLAWQGLGRQMADGRWQKEAPGGEGEALSRIWRVSRLRSVWLPTSVILASVFVLTFWNYRHTERVVVRRAFSVGNVNDFSWRNRVAAWEGSLQIMADHPWLGVGWNQSEQLYERYYRPSKLEESAAIQLNDYLMLGATLGLPALACFAVYLALALRAKHRVSGDETKSEGQRLKAKTLQPSALSLQPSNFRLSPATTCRAGAVVLLVGFWFDGGLFKLATGATFWILLELGRED